ncbi:M20/M25/M40 family metallo-hydrolase [Metabacillus sp. cB07]|uniref:M20/M25/M40 family metallo-hydrolase n=1 Tax=Metabacillus sp. cB07 TaxID=2806989 RepID=UPI0019398473|nr:M20/M25/M40 family metallo-hydrolase [Metabacillus sp. cB07]
MYREIYNLGEAEKIEELTRRLVSINSINGTVGEVEVADFIKETLLSFPYFLQHPFQVWEQQIPNDPLGRKNIFAFVRGKDESKETIIYHSHLDTVGIEDYCSMKENAFHPDALVEFFKTFEYDKEVQRDAQSGDWLFGRGALDMQSGIAVHLANVLHFSENPDELTGNILFMVNPDEESQHKGIITAISELNRLKEEHGLSFKAAINDDFITPLYDNDPHRYIYTGSAGKLLPCFYIYGREAHVGDTLTGIDPNFIASEITTRVHNNLELAENIEGELVLPPTCLYQRDTKEIYNVQTAASSHLYFNYFIYKATTKEIMDKLLNVATEACIKTEQVLFKHYLDFLKRTGLPQRTLSWNIEVTSLGDFIDELESLGVNTAEVSKNVTVENGQLDPRMLCFKIVEALQKLDPNKKPRVIIFFAPPYLPHNYLNPENEGDAKLEEMLREVLDDFAVETNEKFALKKFFPYLSDGSFLSLHETDEEILSLVKNFPEWDSVYPLPVKEIRSLNIPSINIGVYGKDGHKWTERIYKPYTFGILPKLIRKVTHNLLKKSEEILV